MQEAADRQAGAADLDHMRAVAHGMSGQDLPQWRGWTRQMRQQHTRRGRAGVCRRLCIWSRRPQILRHHGIPFVARMISAPPADTLYDILRGVAALTGDAVVADLARLVGKGVPADLSIAFNHKQIASKRWLVDELTKVLPKPDGPVFVLGAWYGVLGALLLAAPRLDIAELVSLDIDPDCAPIAEILNHRHVAAGRFRAVTADMMGLDFERVEGGRPGLVINTSCEHLDDVPGWIATLPAGLPLLLQSNDYVREPDHRSCVPSLEAFKVQAGLSELWFAGALPTKNYTRFMLIGRR